jgi:hypothetical protein
MGLNLRGQRSECRNSIRKISLELGLVIYKLESKDLHSVLVSVGYAYGSFFMEILEK